MSFYQQASSRVARALWGRTRDNRKDVLCRIADYRSGRVPIDEREDRHYEHLMNYHAGEKGCEDAEWLSRPSAVLIIILADIETWNIDHILALYQILCLRQVFTSLTSIRRLVKVQGPDCLEYHCKNGRLSRITMEELEAFRSNPYDDEGDNKYSDDPEEKVDNSSCRAIATIASRDARKKWI